MRAGGRWLQLQRRACGRQGEPERTRLLLAPPPTGTVTGDWEHDIPKPEQWGAAEVRVVARCAELPGWCPVTL